MAKVHYVLLILVCALLLLGQFLRVGEFTVGTQAVADPPPVVAAKGPFSDLDAKFNETLIKAKDEVESERKAERSKKGVRVWLAWIAIFLTVVLGILAAKATNPTTGMKWAIAVVGVLATGLQGADKLLEEQASEHRARHLRIHDAITKAVLKYTSATSSAQAFEAERELDGELGK